MSINGKKRILMEGEKFKFKGLQRTSSLFLHGGELVLF